MPNDERPAHYTVDVGFDTTDYLLACDRYGGGHKVLDQWQALGDLLAYRPGWHFDIVNNGEALWSMGAFGESLLNIQVKEDGRFYCLDYIEDKSSPVGNRPAWLATRSLQEVEAWLEGREEQYRKPSPVLMRLFSEENWDVLRRHTFRVRVSWSDGWYLANVGGLPEEATFGRTLHVVVESAKAMIARCLEAPEELVADLRIRIELDEVAAKQYAEQGS